MVINIITNGLLLTPEVVDRLLPYGPLGVKVTLDGDRDTHNRMRPLRGGQGTFDKILEQRPPGGRPLPHRDRRQLRRVVGRQLSGAPRLPARAGVRRQAREGRLQADHQGEAKPQQPKGFIPLTAISTERQAAQRRVHDVGGGAGSDLSAAARATRATSSTTRCRSCARRRRKRGFTTVDGVHMGPCEIHKQHAYTIGPEGSLYACPGFAGDVPESTGHIDGREDEWRSAAAQRFASITASEELQRLLVHPRVRGRLLGGRAHRAR